MSELLIGIVGCFLLYLLGQLLYPDIPEQELIKMGDDENGQ